ncbi:MAG TPA: zinc ribbon domain-containing protein [Gaiellaceae bacterium]|nr:zinc ribbon domain-containing protein [Gaiellaceae bacterium]
MSPDEHESSRESLGFVQVCPACGVELTPDARFCANCGLRLDEARGTRHVYGALAPGAALVLAVLLLVGAILAVIVGSLVASIVLLVLAGLAFVLFAGAVRRDSESPVSRRVLSGGRRTSASVRLGRVSARAWATAAREVTALHFQAKALRSERRRLLPAFGEAMLCGDTQAADDLRRRLEEIDERLAADERARSASLRRARRRVSEERSPDQPTKESSIADLGR